MSCGFPVMDSMVRIIDSGQSVSVDEMATEARVHATPADVVDEVELAEEKPQLPVTAA